jgi:hypothetical protein
MVIAYIDGKPAEKRTSDFNELMAWLFEQRQEAEFRTDDGQILGRYVPESAAPDVPHLTKEETARRIQEPGAATLDEFWRRMGVK